MIKQIIIPVAAFAVTVTGVSAFNSDIFEKLDLDITQVQVEALEEAHELRKEGGREAAKEVLEESGLQQEELREIRKAVHEYKHEQRSAVREAVENNDYEAFIEAIAESPLAEAVDSIEDFETFVEARELMEAGEYEAARALMEELGIEGKGQRFGGKGGHRGHHQGHDKGFHGKGGFEARGDTDEA